MLNLLVNLLRFFTPPKDANQDQLAVWRASIAGGYILLTALGSFHVAWACGFIPNLPGFALTTDLVQTEAKFEDKFEQLQNQFRKQELRLLEQAILDMRSRQCKVIQSTGDPENNADLKRFVAEKMAKLKYDYRNMAGYEYSVPPCGDL